MMMTEEARQRGKRNKRAGAEFERKVRAQFESEGKIIAKWHNNVDLDAQKMIGAKVMFNPGKRIMTLSTGFPDFVFWDPGVLPSSPCGLECKVRGRLDKTEKLKCEFLLKNKIFNKIFIASKNGYNEILFVEFKSSDSTTESRHDEVQVVSEVNLNV